MKKVDIKKMVREGYAQVAKERGGIPVVTQSC